LSVIGLSLNAQNFDMAYFMKSTESLSLVAQQFVGTLAMCWYVGSADTQYYYLKLIFLMSV